MEIAETHVVYYSKSSPFKVQLTDFDGTVFSADRMASITKAYLKYMASATATPNIADSDIVAHADIFDWITYANTGELLINLGLHAFTEGRDEAAELVIYDSVYPSGRVVAVLDIQISYAVSGDFVGVPVLEKAPLTIEDADYTATDVDFNRPSVRMVSALPRTVTLRPITEENDGGKLSIIIGGAGDITLQCSGDDLILNSTHTSLTGTDKYSSIEIEACFELGIYVVRKTAGHWS